MPRGRQDVKPDDDSVVHVESSRRTRLFYAVARLYSHNNPVVMCSGSPWTISVKPDDHTVVHV